MMHAIGSGWTRRVDSTQAEIKSSENPNSQDTLDEECGVLRLISHFTGTAVSRFPLRSRLCSVRFTCALVRGSVAAFAFKLQTAAFDFKPLHVISSRCISFQTRTPNAGKPQNPRGSRRTGIREAVVGDRIVGQRAVGDDGVGFEHLSHGLLSTNHASRANRRVRRAASAHHMPRANRSREREAAHATGRVDRARAQEDAGMDSRKKQKEDRTNKTVRKNAILILGWN
eukprot:3139275-Rhodomonas_salina.2